MFRVLCMTVATESERSAHAARRQGDARSLGLPQYGFPDLGPLSV